MKVLVLNYEFPPIGGGGGKVSQDISEVLSHRGTDVRVVTSWMPGLPLKESTDGYTVFRIPVLRRHADRCTPFEMVVYLITNLAPVLWQVLVWKPDMIHVHFAVPTGVLALIVNWLARIPYVLTVHLGDIPGGVPEKTAHIFRYIKPLTVPIWTRASAITTGSSSARQLALQAYSGITVDVIHNGINLANFPPTIKSPSRTKRILFAGRFRPQKQPLLVLELLARVTDLDWTAAMVGDGPMMTAARQYHEQQGLKDRVELFGWVSIAELERLMIEADILIMPSSSESMPIVGIWALGYGLAILSSDIPGLSDIVCHGENGFAVPATDAYGFETALRALLASNKDLEKMQRSSRRLAAKFSFDVIGAQYQTLFDQVVEDRSQI